MNESSARFNAIASNYADSEVHSSSPTVQKLQQLIGPQRFDAIVDIAAGAGHFVFAFADRARRLVAVDPAPNMLEAVQAIAQKRGIAVETVAARAESLPLESAQFDLTLCRLAAHHFADIRKAVAEFVRVTKPGGTVAIIDLQGADDPQIDAINHEIEVLHDPTHVRSYRSSQWKELLSEAGLEVELHPGLTEFPKGLSVERWCEIAASGVEAKTRIRALLQNASNETRKTLAVQKREEEFYLTIPTILLVAKKPSAVPATGP